MACEHLEVERPAEGLQNYQLALTWLLACQLPAQDPIMLDLPQA